VGAISIVGCHATNDPVDICIDIGDRFALTSRSASPIKIEQGNCEHEVTHACVSGCP